MEYPFVTFDPSMKIQGFHESYTKMDFDEWIILVCAHDYQDAARKLEMVLKRAREFNLADLEDEEKNPRQCVH